MKLFLDFFPIVLFFAAFKFWGIYVATGVAIYTVSQSRGRRELEDALSQQEEQP